MAINVSQAFKRTSKNPIDETFALTKAQMLTVNDNLMPDYYFTVCQDDGCFYLYDKTATASLTTGKFTKFEGGTDNLAFGYLNATNGKFYKESTYTTEIAGDTSKLYITLDTDYLYRYDTTNGFVQIGGSGVGGTVEGYLNPTNGKFYEESTYTTEITGEVGKLYVTLDTDKTYRYDSTNGFVEVGGGDTIQYSTMPTASADYLNRIVQFTGTTDANYTNGLFYKCVSDGATPPVYSWEQKPVEPKEVVRIAKADFDLLPTAKKNDGTAYFIPDADMVDNITVMGNRFDKANIYTTTERMIGSYLGKPLYQKTFVGSFPTSITAEFYRATITHDISDIDVVTDIKVTALHTAMDSTLYHGFYSTGISSGNTSGTPNVATGVGCWVNKTKLEVITNNSAFNGKAVNITIQYTKTTDGTVTIGSPNDYSTSEMMVGTYVNGKPIYQITKEITVSVDTNGTNKEVSIDISDLNSESLVSMNAVMANISVLPQILWSGSMTYVTRAYRNPTLGKLVVASNRLDDNGKVVRITMQYTKTD